MSEGGPGDQVPGTAPDPESLTASLLAALGATDRAERSRAIAGAAEMVDPDLLIEAVADQADARRRNAAMDALAKGGARSVPALVRGLRHDDPEVVMFSAGVLARTGSPAAIPHLVSLLDHQDVNVAQQVIDSLSQMRSSLAVDALVKVLDRDPWLRFAAVHALGEIGDRRAVAALAPLLEDPLVRDAVIGAMGKIGSTEALSCLFGVVHESPDTQTFGQCLRAIGEALEFQPNERALQNITEWTELASPSWSSLHDRLNRVLAGETSEDSGAGGPDSRPSAAMIVKALRLRPLYTALVLAGRDPTLREVLEFSVISIGDEIVPVLQDGLGSPNAAVRTLACECLGALRDRGAAPMVASLVGDPIPAVRAAAINALMRLGHDAAIPAIAGALADSETEVRETAVAALCRMDVEAVTASLLKQQNDADPPDRRPLLAVMRANPHPAQHPFILACLSDQSPPVRQAAAEAVAHQPNVDVVEALEPLLQDPDLEVRRSVVGILGGIRSRRVRQLLTDQVDRDPATRSEAVRALGKLGDTTVIPFLTSIFDQESPDTRLAIIEALRELPDPATEPFLARQLGSPDPALRRATVHALGAMALPNALRQLVPVARDPDEGVRLAVAQALRGWPSPQAEDALSRLRHDTNRRVAAVALQSLDRIRQSDVP
jgi:HEAT repeat protein